MNDGSSFGFCGRGAALVVPSSAVKAREPRASVVISSPDFLSLPCVRVWEHLPDGLL